MPSINFKTEEEGGGQQYGSTAVPDCGPPPSSEVQSSVSHPPVDHDKQKANSTAQRIRGALEASGLAGNLTTEELQNLKKTQ